MSEHVLTIPPIEKVIEGYNESAANEHEMRDEYNAQIESRTREALAQHEFVRVVYSDRTYDRVRLNAFDQIEPLDETP